jgi:hypothetical protein
VQHRGYDGIIATESDWQHDCWIVDLKCHNILVIDDGARKSPHKPVVAAPWVVQVGAVSPVNHTYTQTMSYRSMVKCHDCHRAVCFRWRFTARSLQTAVVQSVNSACSCSFFLRRESRLVCHPAICRQPLCLVLLGYILQIS